MGAVSLAACSAEVAAPTPEHTESFEDLVARALADAQSSGASQSQLALLEDVRDSGEVTVEAARLAAHASVDCMNGAGVVATFTEEVDEVGLLLPGYVATIGDDEAKAAVMEDCDRLESFWVNMLYQVQPTSQALADAHLEAIAPAVRECLEAAGVATDPEATPREVQRLAIDTLVESEGAIDCLTPPE